MTAAAIAGEIDNERNSGEPAALEAGQIRWSARESNNSASSAGCQSLGDHTQLECAAHTADGGATMAAADHEAPRAD